MLFLGDTDTIILRPPNNSLESSSSEDLDHAEESSGDELNDIVDNVDPKKRDKARGHALTVISLTTSILSFLPFIINWAKGEKGEEPDEETKKQLLHLIQSWRKIPNNQF